MMALMTNLHTEFTISFYDYHPQSILILLVLLSGKKKGQKAKKYGLLVSL